MSKKKEEERKQIDSALKQRDVKSQFLEEYFESNDKLISYDPRDPFGRRLSGWKPGDTILSVSYKKVCHYVRTVLDPDTYQKASYKELKRNIQLFDQYLLMTGFMLTFPLVVFIPYILPRIQRAKREYFMHQYQKRKMFQEALGIKTDKIPLHHLRNILRRQDKQ